MRKKQLHIVNRYYLPVLAGIEKCMTETYTRFNRDEWDITIHTSADTLDAPNSLPEEEKMDGLNIRRYSSFHGLFFPFLPWNRADIVVLNNFSIIPNLPLLAYAFFLKVSGMKRAKLVLAPHGGFTPAWISDFGPIQKAVKRFLHNQIGRRLINHTVDVVHSVADWEKERLIAVGVSPVKIYVIPNGVEDDAYLDKPEIDATVKKLVKDAGDYIVTISRIHPLKNLEVVIKALARVPKLKLIIVGQCHDQPYCEQLIELARNLGIEDRIILAGAVTGVDKFHIIRNAIALAHMSRFEVDPLVIKEALSQGSIVIGAKNTGIARVLIDGVNGYLVSTHDEVKLAETISFLAYNPKNKEVAMIRKYNHGHRDLYRWNSVSAQLELLFTNLLPQWSLSYSS